VLVYFLLSPAPPPAFIYTLSLHDALPILERARRGDGLVLRRPLCHRRTQAPGLRRGHLLPRLADARLHRGARWPRAARLHHLGRSEEHTSELQSPYDLVCRLLLEKKK